MSQVKLEELAQGNSAFALDLYQQLRQADSNLFFSPFSLSTALAMTCAGARGETESQMARVLHFGSTDESLHIAFAGLQEKIAEVEAQGRIKLKVANSLWPQVGYSFLAEFVSLVQTYYGVTITPVDYSDSETARQIVNAWVEEKTEKKITNLIPPGVFNALTRLTLVNAIYFKGDWADKFDARLTKRGDFWAPQGKVNASMMSRTDEYNYAETGALQILELPYAGNALSMLILLPKEKDGLPRLEGQVTPAFLEQATAKLSKQQVFVSMPKFKVEAAFQLNEALIELGMTDAFDDGKANFAGMDDDEKSLFISAALHKAFIDVNEDGSEAAAASAIVMQLRSTPMQRPPVFRADHPFLFFIRENQTGSILFTGRLLKP
ncbi:MAG: serpin family protein [Anaerolineaceae bacterium]|nr:MAG: serpin family protein [Anaerolineaceae bacterium]